MELEPFLTNKEVAAILKIHPAVVDRMARRGEIPGFKVGKYWRYRKSDLFSFRMMGDTLS